MKRWYKYIKPYLTSFILGPLGMIVEVIGEMFMPLLLAELINSGDFERHINRVRRSHRKKL